MNQPDKINPKSTISKIMVVDDDPHVHNIFKQLFDKMGYEIVSAKSGEEAVEKAFNEVFSMVLCDIEMSGIDGLATLKAIKKINPALPVVIMSGRGTHDRVINALGNGASDFIAKPFSLRQTTVILNKILHPELESDSEYRSPMDSVLREGYYNLLIMTNKFIEIKNRYLLGHSDRVAEHVLKMTKALKIPEKTEEVFRCAAALHDIGKIGVTDSFLLKKGKLDEFEWRDVKAHPSIGRIMVEQVKLFRAEEPIIEHHHEWYNGAGYPKGIKGEEIPLGSRIISVADAYDAMTSERPYRAAMDKTAALNIIKEYSGKQFDPKVVEVFLSVI
ncbi:MAG: HD domain-containing phosphohydrolase [Planctomycetota bacterium]